MKTKLTFISISFFLIQFILIAKLHAQEAKTIDYECLDLPFEVLTPNESIHHIKCQDGLTVIDTLEDPCFDFYEEDEVLMRAWYYSRNNAESNLEYFFDRISLRSDEIFDPGESKYLELEKASIWFLFLNQPSGQSTARLRIRDLSNGGINFGSSMEQGAVYYASLEELANHDFPNIQLHFEGEQLILEGEISSIFLGGDHLLIEKITLESGLVSTLEDMDLEAVQIFPNPARHQLNIQGEFPNQSEISIINVNGQILQSSPIISTNTRMNISALVEGIYWLQITSKGQIIYTQSIQKY